MQFPNAEQLFYIIFAAGSKGLYDFWDAQVEKLGLSKKVCRKEPYGNACRPREHPGYLMEAKDKAFDVFSRK